MSLPLQAKWYALFEVESSCRPSWQSILSLAVLCGLQKEALEFIWVAVAYRASLFLLVRPQAEIETIKFWWLWSSKFLGSKVHVGVQPVLHTLCRVCRRSVLLEGVVWLLNDLLNRGKNFRLQNFFLSGRGWL